MARRRNICSRADFLEKKKPFDSSNGFALFLCCDFDVLRFCNLDFLF